MVRVVITSVLIVLCSNSFVFAQAEAPPAADSIITDETHEAIADPLMSTDQDEQVIDQAQLLLDDAAIAASHRRYRANNSLTLRSRVIYDPEAEKTSNYTTGYYTGSSLRSATLLSARTADVDLYITQSKDAGEPQFFDLLSASLSLRKKTPIAEGIRLNRLIVGDYSLSYGNGLLLSRGHPNYPSKQFLFGKGSVAESINPYHSTNALRYLRGAAAELQLSPFTVGVFFSSRLIDAELDSTGIVFAPQSNYHRTATELNRKNAARQILLGGSVAMEYVNEEHHGFSIGAATYRLSLDHPIVADSTVPLFSGDNAKGLSVYSQVSIAQGSVELEYAIVEYNALRFKSFAANIQSEIITNLHIVLNYHFIPLGYYAPYSGTFGLYTTSQNEKGYFVGTLFTASPALTIFGYLGQGSTDMVGQSTTIRTTIDARFGGSYKVGAATIDGQCRLFRQTLSPVDSEVSLKYHPEVKLTYDLTQHIRIKAQTKYLFKQATVGSESGYVYALGLRIQPTTKISMNIGASYFNTDSFSARLISDELGLPAVAALNSLYGVGVRYSLQARYTPLRMLTVDAMIGQSNYTYPETAPRKHDTSIGLQVTLHL